MHKMHLIFGKDAVIPCMKKLVKRLQSLHEWFGGSYQLPHSRKTEFCKKFFSGAVINTTHYSKS